MTRAKNKKPDNGNKPEKKSKERELDEMTTDANSINVKGWKVRPAIKITVIVLSVLALSWFFEGYRQVQKGLTFPHLAVFISGTLVTAALLWLQGFWIYLEEKSKGTLRKRIAHFDRLQEYFEKKRGQ